MKLFPISNHWQDSKKILSSKEGVPNEKVKASW